MTEVTPDTPAPMVDVVAPKPKEDLTDPVQPAPSPNDTAPAGPASSSDLVKRLVAPPMVREFLVPEDEGDDDDDDNDDDDMDSLDEIDAHARAADDEMMYIRKGVLDTVVIQQQKRIAELERKLMRSKKEVARLRAVGQSVKGIITSRPAAPKIGTTTSMLSPPRKEHRDISPPGTDLSTVTVESIGVARQSQVITKRPSPKKHTQPIARGAVSPAVTTDRVVVHEGQTRYWTADEHERFMRGVSKFGPRNYTAISTFVKSRTPKQVRTHAQKYEMRLAREAIRKSSVQSTSPPSLMGDMLETPSLRDYPEVESMNTKLEATVSGGKSENQILAIPGPQQFVDPVEIGLLSEGRPVLDEGLGQDMVTDRALLHSFDRSFSKSDLKSLSNDEDQWLNNL